MTSPPEEPGRVPRAVAYGRANQGAGRYRPRRRGAASGLNTPNAAPVRGGQRAANGRRVWVFAVLLACTVVLGAAMLSRVLAAPAQLAVEPPPPPAGVEPSPQPPIGRGSTGEPVDPGEAPGWSTQPQPEPVAHTRTSTDASRRSPGQAPAPGDTATGSTVLPASSGTGSPTGPSTAQPQPGTPTTAVDPADPPAAGDSGGVYYKNCAKARKAGALPLFRGEPGYSDRLDKDGDGEACNKGNE